MLKLSYTLRKEGEKAYEQNFKKHKEIQKAGEYDPGRPGSQNPRYETDGFILGDRPYTA